LSNVVVSNKAILLPNVVMSDEADAETHIGATMEHMETKEIQIMV
jgi:hypothetical protein